MADAWHFFEGKRDGKTVQVMVNTGFHAKVPLDGFDYCLRFSVALEDPRSDGLARARESAKLTPFEDVLMERALASDQLAYVGRTTSQGERAWLVYATTNAPKQLLFDADDQSAGYRVAFEALRDPEWRSYLDQLYPTRIDWLYINNENRLRDLNSMGIDPASERNVEHTVRFASDEDAQSFRDAIQNLGAEIIATPHNGLRFVRKHALDLPSLNAVTIALMLYAQEFNGDYLGWDIPSSELPR